MAVGRDAGVRADGERGFGRGAGRSGRGTARASNSGRRARRRRSFAGSRRRSGSQGSSAVVKPAFGVASHCIGVRSGSRPAPTPISMPGGSTSLSGGIVHVLHADLVAVVHRRRAAQGEQQHRGDARLRAADAGGDARPVVVAEHPVRPAAGRQRGFVLVDRGGDDAGVPGLGDELEVEGQVRAVAVLSVVARPGARSAGRSRR